MGELADQPDPREHNTQMGLGYKQGPYICCIRPPSSRCTAVLGDDSRRGFPTDFLPPRGALDVQSGTVILLNLSDFGLAIQIQKRCAWSLYVRTTIPRLCHHHLPALPA